MLMNPGGWGEALRPFWLIGLESAPLAPRKSHLFISFSFRCGEVGGCPCSGGL